MNLRLLAIIAIHAPLLYGGGDSHKTAIDKMYTHFRETREIRLRDQQAANPFRETNLEMTSKVLNQTAHDAEEGSEFRTQLGHSIDYYREHPEQRRTLPLLPGGRAERRVLERRDRQKRLSEQQLDELTRYREGRMVDIAVILTRVPAASKLIVRSVLERHNRDSHVRRRTECRFNRLRDNVERSCSRLSAPTPTLSRTPEPTPRLRSQPSLFLPPLTPAGSP